MDAEYDLIMVFVVATATYGTASIILGNLGSLQLTDVLDIILKLLPFRLIDLLAIASGLIHLVHLVHDLSVSHLIPPLLGQL